MSPKTPIKYFAVFLIYAAVILSFSFPLVDNLSSRALSGNAIDSQGIAWNQWLVKKAVLGLNPQALWHTDMVGYPAGKNMIFDLGFPLLGISSIPFQILYTYPFYHNIFLIMLMASGAWAGFILIEYLYKDRLTAFLSGLFFLINPYVVFQVSFGRPEQVALLWLPLFMLALFKIKNEQKPIYYKSAFLLLILATFSYWYYGVFLVLLSIIFLLYFGFTKQDRKLISRMSLMLGLYALLMLLIFFFPVIIKGMRPLGYLRLKHFPAYQQITAAWAPAYFQYLLDYTSLKLIPRIFPFIFLVSIMAFLNKRYLNINLFCIIAGGLFCVLSFGPYLRVLDRAIPLPYILFYYVIPSFPRLWWPINCFAITLLSSMVLLASFIHWVRLKRSIGGNVILIILACLYLAYFYNRQYKFFDYRFLSKTKVLNYAKIKQAHPVYIFLKAQSDSAIIELPFKNAQLDFLFNQTIHGQKVFNCPGYSIRHFAWPKEQLRLLQENSFLECMSAVSAGKQPLKGHFWASVKESAQLREGLRQLRALGFKFIVVNPQYPDSYAVRPRVLLARLRKLLGRPVQEYPDGVLLYEISSITGAKQ